MYGFNPHWHVSSFMLLLFQQEQGRTWEEGGWRMKWIEVFVRFCACLYTGAVVYTGVVVHAGTVVYTGAVLQKAAVVLTGAVVYTGAVLHADAVV